MSQPLPSSEPNKGAIQPKPWLLKHYQEKRQRTVRLVKVAVDQLVSNKETVTIEAICHASIECDPAGRGVKKSAILENQEAHAYYREHSTTYRNAQLRKRQGAKKAPRKTAEVQPLRIHLNRDVDRARYRYLQMTKPEIVERLLQVEQAYAELTEQQSQLQFAWAELEHLSTSTRELR